MKAVGITIGATVQLQPAGASGFEASGKSALLLALIALEEQVERRRAAQLLWPQSAESQARNNLRTLVHRLNQRFGAELVCGGERLTVDAALAPVQLADEATLVQALESGGPEACELLAQAGVEEADNEPLAEWLAGARQRWRRRVLAGLASALPSALQRGDTAHAVALARAAVQLEPLSEQLHRQLMDTLARCGDRAAALAAYEDCKARLREHLGVLPDLQTRTVQLRILQDQSQDQPAIESGATTRSVAAGLTPLGGAARFALVEREGVLAQLQAAQAQAQHVALQGEAGAGKTRLLREWIATQTGAEQVCIHPGARAQPYSALAQLLQEVQPRRAVRIGLPEQVELARLAPLAFAAVQPSQAALSAPRLHAALRRWLEGLRQEGLQQLVIDDLHYADAESQAALAAVLGPAASAPLPMLLLAHRSGEIEAGLAEALVGAQVGARLRMLPLPRLSAQGVRTLLQAMQAQHTEVLAEQLYQRTGGNPLFVIELAQHAQEHAEATASTTDNLQALLRSRLGACTQAAQQLAAAAAVAAQDFSVELAMAVTGQSALALMPAWGELQQRGLFADHGLAHDLVREAVLAPLPKAIARTLHRQVAQHLEQQGLKGAAVLAHWLAAEDADRALPHLVQRLDDATTAGLDTESIELELLALMQRLSDKALLANLWLSAEVCGDERFGAASTTVQAGIKALVERVSTLPHGDACAAWLAFERGRLLGQWNAQCDLAYNGLAKAIQLTEDASMERARSELMLGRWAIALSGSAKEHIHRARAIAAAMPASPRRQRLTMLIEVISLVNGGDVPALLRSQLAAWRAARRRLDHAAINVARLQIFDICLMRSLWPTAWRFSWEGARPDVADGPVQLSTISPTDRMECALACGHYAAALRASEDAAEDTESEERTKQSVEALVWTRLGQWERARVTAHRLSVDPGSNPPWALRTLMLVRQQIDVHDGTDPLPSMRELTAIARSIGVAGERLRLWEWDQQRLCLAAEERAVVGLQLLDEVRHAKASISLPTVLLPVAEACMEAGRTDFRVLALEAARELRRGRSLMYLPDGLVRCARLLQASDPSIADDLMHVARRWVRQALADVPDFARETFINEVPVNRLLLGPA